MQFHHYQHTIKRKKEDIEENSVDCKRQETHSSLDPNLNKQTVTTGQWEGRGQQDGAKEWGDEVGD